MRNLAMLVILGLATIGFWVCVSMFLMPIFFVPGESYRAYLFGLITIPDCLLILAYAGWAFCIARISRGTFSGPRARSLQVLSTGFVVAVYLHGAGVFISANHDSNFLLEFLLVRLGFASLIALGAWAGLRGLVPQEGPEAASPNQSSSEPGSDR